MHYRHSNKLSWRTVRTSVAALAVIGFLATSSRVVFAATVLPPDDYPPDPGYVSDILGLVVDGIATTLNFCPDPSTRPI